MRYKYSLKRPGILKKPFWVTESIPGVQNERLTQINGINDLTWIILKQDGSTGTG